MEFRAKLPNGAVLRLKAHTVQTITHRGWHRIEIYVRPDGSFGYRCEFFDQEPLSTVGWTQYAPSTDEIFTSQEAALEAANAAARKQHPVLLGDEGK